MHFRCTTRCKNLRQMPKPMHIQWNIHYSLRKFCRMNGNNTGEWFENKSQVKMDAREKVEASEFWKQDHKPFHVYELCVYHSRFSRALPPELCVSLCICAFATKISTKNVFTLIICKCKYKTEKRPNAVKLNEKKEEKINSHWRIF